MPWQDNVGIAAIACPVEQGSTALLVPATG